MERQEIYKRVRSIINTYRPDIELKLDMKLSGKDNGLDMSSLEIVSMIIEIEKEFDIIIDYDVLFENVEDIVDEIEKICNNC